MEEKTVYAVVVRYSDTGNEYTRVGGLDKYEVKTFLDVFLRNGFNVEVIQ
jgi:hypothetical protein